MAPVSMETADWPRYYLNIILGWWGYPSMHSLLGVDQSPSRDFCGTKTFWVKMDIFTYFGSYLAMPKNFG